MASLFFRVKNAVISEQRLTTATHSAFGVVAYAFTHQQNSLSRNNGKRGRPSDLISRAAIPLASLSEIDTQEHLEHGAYVCIAPD